MKRILPFFANLSERQLIALITALSCLLTLRVMYIQHGWVNNDSVLYFEVARLFSIGEWKQGLSLYNWPLYSTLIALVHKATSLSIQHAAQLLNVIFFAITTYSFITLIRLAGGNKITIACGALLLFSSPYIVGDVLPMLLRDQGFWAFFLTSLIFFIRFYRDGKSGDAMLWQLSAILAVLFRIEAITFLLALPLVFIAEPDMSKGRKAAKILKASFLTITLAVLVAIAIAAISPITIKDFGRLADPLVISANIHGQITEGLNSKAEIMGREVLGNYIDDYALTGLIATLVIVLIIKSINSLGLLATAILAFTYKSLGKLVAKDSGRILIWISAMALANASIILLHTFILSTRYVVALSLMMLIFAAFGLGALVQRLTASRISKLKQRLIIFLLALLTASVIINILPKRAGYNHEQDAVAWVKARTIAEDKVFYASPRERYYAGAPYTTRSYDEWDYAIEAISNGSIHDYDFLVINVEDKLEENTQLLIKKLPNHRFAAEFFAVRDKKKVVVFVRNSEPQ